MLRLLVGKLVSGDSGISVDRSYDCDLSYLLSCLTEKMIYDPDQTEQPKEKYLKACSRFLEDCRRRALREKQQIEEYQSG